MSETDRGLVVRLERSIAAEAAAVWEVISTAEGMAAWLGSRTFEASVGGRVLFDVRHDAQRWLMFGQVKELLRDERLSFSWQEFDCATLEVWPVPTLVTISLEQQGSHTLCRLEHSGFEGLSDGALQFEAYSSGWGSRDVLEKLEQLLLTRNSAQ